MRDLLTRLEGRMQEGRQAEDPSSLQALKRRMEEMETRVREVEEDRDRQRKRADQAEEGTTEGPPQGVAFGAWVLGKPAPTTGATPRELHRRARATDHAQRQGAAAAGTGTRRPAAVSSGGSAGDALQQVLSAHAAGTSASGEGGSVRSHGSHRICTGLTHAQEPTHVHRDSQHLHRDPRCMSLCEGPHTLARTQ